MCIDLFQTRWSAFFSLITWNLTNAFFLNALVNFLTHSWRLSIAGVSFYASNAWAWQSELPQIDWYFAIVFLCHDSADSNSNGTDLP